MQRLFPIHHIRKSDPAPALWTLSTMAAAALLFRS